MFSYIESYQVGLLEIPAYRQARNPVYPAPKSLVGMPGIEPGLPAPKAGVLPVYDIPIIFGAGRTFRYTTTRNIIRIHGKTSFVHRAFDKNFSRATSKSILAFFINCKEGKIAMGSGKAFVLPSVMPRRKKSPLSKLQTWQKQNVGFIILVAQRPGIEVQTHFELWEVELTSPWSINDTFFIGEINTQEKTFQRLDIQRREVDKICYLDIEIMSGTVFFRYA